MSVYYHLGVDVQPLLRHLINPDLSRELVMLFLLERGRLVWVGLVLSDRTCVLVLSWECGL